MTPTQYKVRCQRIKARAEQTRSRAEQIARYMDNIIADAEFNKQIQAKAAIKEFANKTAKDMQDLFNSFEEASC